MKLSSEVGWRSFPVEMRQRKQKPEISSETLSSKTNNFVRSLYMFTLNHYLLFLPEDMIRCDAYASGRLNKHCIRAVLQNRSQTIHRQDDTHSLSYRPINTKPSGPWLRLREGIEQRGPDGGGDQRIRLRA